MTALDQFTYDQLIGAVEKLWPNELDPEDFLANASLVQLAMIENHLSAGELNTVTLCTFSLN